MPTATPAATAPPLRPPPVPCSPLGLGLLLATLCLGGCGTAELPAEVEAAPVGQARQSLTLTLQPGASGKDAFITLRPGLTGSPNGHSNLLPAEAWTWSGVPGTLRGLLDFDLPPVLSGATITNATLVLSADLSNPVHPVGHWGGPTSNSWRLEPITSAWSEDTTSWNTQPSTDPTRAISLPGSTSNNQTYSVNVTGHIITRLTQPALMQGWMLRLDTEREYRALQFATGDHPDSTRWPRLVIDYTLNTPPPTELRGRVVRGDRDNANPWDNPPLTHAMANGVPVVIDAGNGHTTTTAPDGSFVFSNLPAGTYTLRARLPGWTFGSPGFQDLNYTVTLQPGQSISNRFIFGWNSDPIVFVHGWTSNPADFANIPETFEDNGYYVHDWGQLDTSPLWTPPFSVNARRVKQWIDLAKFETGRDKVILYGHSMGGLVSRAYVESGRYDGDVSQLFTFGSPHLGVPTLHATACYVLPRPDAICQMTKPGMGLFNLTHFKRSGVDYHLVAGKAPMWTTKQVCFRIFRRRICILSIPWPDFSYRNGFGWAMGALIPFADDGLAQAYSASGMPGFNIDRYLTREVHTTPMLGHRDYHAWNDGASNSEEAFAQCSRRILIDRSTTTCGTRFWPGPPPDSYFRAGPPPESSEQPAAGPPLALEEDPSMPMLDQGTHLQEEVLLPGQRKVRRVQVEGGPSAFTASWPSGSVAFSLIDPTGKVIDPAYVASLEEVDPNDPEVVQVTEPDPDAVAYLPEPQRAAYYFPLARPGLWQVVMVGGSDLPAGGASVTTGASFDSPLEATFSTDKLSYDPNSAARLTVRFSQPVSSATVQVKLARAGSVQGTLQLSRISASEYAGSYSLPGPSGYVALDWSVTGMRSDNIAFERGGREFVQLHSTALRLGTGHTDRAIPRAEFPALSSALAVSLKVNSAYEGGDLGVAAELVAPDGSVVSRTVASVTAALGDNLVELRFPAEDIYQSRADGPYTLRNVRLLDERDASLLSQEATGRVHTTGAYAYRSFAPRPSTPAVFLNGPYRVTAGRSLTLSASGTDPDSGDVLTYAWDLDGDGGFETTGATAEFAAPWEASGLRTVRVRVTDSTGLSAEASATVEIVPPAANQPPVARCRNVAIPIDPGCSGCESVNDGSYDPDERDSVTCTQSPGGPYGPGTHTVTLTCRDTSGATSSCQGLVSVYHHDTCTGRVPVEGSAESVGMLGFLNSASATLQVLDDQVPLDSRAAHNLVARRDGPDGSYGTADDRPFRSLAEVDAVSYVGNEALAALTAYARSTGWVLLEDHQCLGTLESVVFTAGDARRVLALANQANVTFLDEDVGLDRRTVDGIVAGRLFPHIRALADSFWVGPTHMQLLFNYATQEVVPGELCHHPGACESVHMECMGFASNDWGRCRDLVPIPGEGSVCPQNSHCGPGLFCAGDRICRPGWMAETLFDTTDVSLPASVSTQAAPFLMVMGQAQTPVDLEVQVDLSHPSPGDLRIWLVSPPMDEGVLPPLLLWDGPNAGGRAFQPRLPVYSGTSRGEYVNGPWELRIENVTGARAGTLKGWTMKVTSRW